jgi:hypothetical protein
VTARTEQHPDEGQLISQDAVLLRTRWELATVAGRLRNLQAERDDLVARHEELARDRDRSRDLVRALRRSRSYRVGQALVSIARPTAQIVRKLRHHPAAPERHRAGTTPPAVLPTHVYVAIGLQPETLQEFTRSLGQRITVHADHLPVVLTDCASFRHARARGVILEYLPDAGTWERHRPGVPWDELLTDRLARLFRDHGCVRTVVLDPDRPPTLADLLA